MSFKLPEVSWNAASICRSLGPTESTVWRTSAMVWLKSLRSTGPSPTCSMIGSKNELLDTLDRLAGHQGHGRLAGRDDVHVAHSGEALSDADLDVLPHLLDQIGRQGNAHSAPECALHLHQVQVDDISRVQASHAHRAADPNALAVAEDHVDGLLGREEAGAVTGQAHQGEQSRQGRDHDETNRDVPY